MAHIVRVSISGLVGRKSVFRQELNRDINVFFGLNGSGKTSLLRILRAAMANDVASLATVPFDQVEVTIASGDGDHREFVYSIERKLFDRIAYRQRDLFGDDPQMRMLTLGKTLFRDLHMGWKIKPDLPSDATGEWPHVFLPTTRLLRLAHDTYLPTEQLFESEDFLARGFAQYIEREWLRFASEMQMEVRERQGQALAEIVCDLFVHDPPQSSNETWLSIDQSFRELTAFLVRQSIPAETIEKREFAERCRTNPLLQRVATLVNRVQREIDELTAPRTKLQGLIAKMFESNTRITLGDSSITAETRNWQTIPLRSLSSGERHLLFILLHALSADNSSLIIDEPEISMHVDWQRELIEAIREINPRCQLILATHSPEIMADVDESKVFRLI